MAKPQGAKGRRAVLGKKGKEVYGVKRKRPEENLKKKNAKQQHEVKGQEKGLSGKKKVVTGKGTQPKILIQDESVMHFLAKLGFFLSVFFGFLCTSLSVVACFDNVLTALF